MKENRWSTTQFDRPPMTKPRTHEEIAEEWFKIHDGMCVRSIDGQPYREHFLAALREAADARASELDEFFAEERILMERLLSRLEPRTTHGSCGVIVNSYAVAEIPDWQIRQRLDAIASVQARSRTEEPKP